MINFKNKKTWLALFSLVIGVGLSNIAGCSVVNNNQATENSKISSEESISEKLYKYEITLKNDNADLNKFVSENLSKNSTEQNNIDDKSDSVLENGRLRVKSV